MKKKSEKENYYYKKDNEIFIRYYNGTKILNQDKVFFLFF